MFLSDQVLKVIELILHKNQAIKQPAIVDKMISGGSINSCYRLRAADDFFFVKINSASRFKNMFALEAQGLKLIRKSGTIKVPAVMGVGVSGDEQFLLMEWIEQGGTSSEMQYDLGRQLAQLHTESSDFFGLEYDNYIGSLSQSNRQCNNWTDFFITERIEPLLALALDKNLISTSLIPHFRRLYKVLPSLYPAEKPSFLHGDLWSGNIMASNSGQPILIDPAVYFGHREMDIAMTGLFGGFTSDFYAGYEDGFPLEKGWQHRLDFWNLYPLLVHLNLFGTGYLPQIKSILGRFS